LILVSFLQAAPGLLFCQTLLKPTEDIHVGEFTLSEPCLGDDAQTLTEHAEGLGTVSDDDDSLLNGRTGNIVGTVDEEGRVYLSRAGDAEE
jgi:hypothetical protein